MNILVLGGTGFIGSALCKALASEGHALVLKTRDPDRWKDRFRSISDFSQLAAQERFDAVVNLAGEPIADKRWTAAQKQRIVQSRTESTHSLLEWLSGLPVKPRVLIQASAIGYYGVSESEDIVDESVGGDGSFSSELCRLWEAGAQGGESLGIRTCVLRTGVVLGHGGALTRMLPAFRWGLGGRLGDGQQWFSWIHLADMVGIIRFCLERPDMRGAYNCTAPHPVRNETFTRALARVLHRPAVLHLPAWLVERLTGQMGRELLLRGRKVVPARLLAEGYAFQYTDLECALKAILSGPQSRSRIS